MTEYMARYKIWDIVEHSFNWMKFMVIWYNIVWDAIRYVCTQPEKTDRTYLYDIEIKESGAESIWFTIKNT